MFKITSREDSPFRKFLGRVDAMNGNQYTVSSNDLFCSEFLSSCSSFASTKDFFAASGFKLESAEDFALVPDEAWDSFIEENTSYQSWFEIRRAARQAWIKRTLHSDVSLPHAAELLAEAELKPIVSMPKPIGKDAPGK